jgi:hypothetical protein
MYFNLLLPFVNVRYSHWQVIALFLGEAEDRVHIHNLLKDIKYHERFQSLEVERNSPLSYLDKEFERLNMKWIYKPGVHVGIFQDGQAGSEIIFMLKIRYIKFY